MIYTRTHTQASTIEQKAFSGINNLMCRKQREERRNFKRVCSVSSDRPDAIRVDCRNPIVSFGIDLKIHYRTDDAREERDQHEKCKRKNVSPRDGRDPHLTVIASSTSISILRRCTVSDYPLAWEPIAWKAHDGIRDRDGRQHRRPLSEKEEQFTSISSNINGTRSYFDGFILITIVRV